VRKDITKAITSAQGWLSKPLQQGKSQIITIKVTPPSGVSDGTSLTLLILGRSQTDPNQLDAVKAITVLGAMVAP
jgi:hypothetical protein